MLREARDLVGVGVRQDGDLGLEHPELRAVVIVEVLRAADVVVVVVAREHEVDLLQAGDAPQLVEAALGEPILAPSSPITIARFVGTAIADCSLVA
jgi:hypothetical protein